MISDQDRSNIYEWATKHRKPEDRPTFEEFWAVLDRSPLVCKILNWIFRG